MGANEHQGPVEGPGAGDDIADHDRRHDPGDVAEHAANGTLYYETKRFSIRGSVAYRSRYLTAVPGTEGNSYNGTNSTTNVDAQASYNISDRLKVSLEAINLTDELNDQFVDVANRLNVLTHSGRQFNLGVR